MTKIISLLNHKGGVGKTTSSANIAAGLAILGQHVLVIDLDPQANLTLHFGYKNESEANIYKALKGSVKLPVIPLNEKLDLVPSHLDLSAAETELINEAGREYLLKDLLKPIQKEYDYILIDCPPSLGLLTLNALSVSNIMLIPVELSSFALAGMIKLFEVIEKVQKRLNENLSDYRLLITKVDKRKIVQRDIRDTLFERYKDKILDTSINTNVALEEAQLVGQDIFQYNPSSSGAKDYENVCNEILKLK